MWLESEDQFRAHVDDWDNALAESGIDDPFLLSAFLLTWWGQFSEGRRLCVFAAYDGEKLVGGLPLYVERRMGQNIMRFPGGDDDDYAVANYTNFLACKKRWNGVVDLFIDCLDLRKDWDVIHFHRLHATEEQIEHIVRSFKRRCLHLLHRDQQAVFMIDVPESFEHFLKNSSKKKRKAIRQSYRDADSYGRLHLEQVSGALDIEQLFDRYVVLSRESYRVRGGKSTFEDQKLTDFFRRLLICLDRVSVVGAYELKIDQQTIAIGFCYSICGNINYIITAFSFEFESYRPGYLLMSELLKKAIEIDASHMNLYTGETPQKLYWSNRRETTYQLFVGRDNFKNRLIKTKLIIKLKDHALATRRLLGKSTLLRTLKRKL